MGVGIDFFATKSDLTPGLERIESPHRFQYVLDRMFPSPTIEPIFSALAIEDLGIVLKNVGVRQYLVFDAATELKVQVIPQRKGGVLYTVDLLPENPTGFAFCPGGMLEGEGLIRGSVGTATGDPTSIALCRAFYRELRRGFIKIHSYYVGPEAVRLLDEGMRLTIGVGASPHTDLKR